MTSDRPTVRCGCCDGQGIVLLPLPLYHTLLALHLRGPMTAAELCEDFQSYSSDEVRLTAMCNRLATLLDLNLVSCLKAEAGRKATWIWSAAESEA